MKEWKVWFTLRYRNGETADHYMHQMAPTIGAALAEAEAKVELVARNMRAAAWSIWDIGLMDDDVF